MQLFISCTVLNHISLIKSQPRACVFSGVESPLAFKESGIYVNGRRVFERKVLLDLTRAPTPIDQSLKVVRDEQGDLSFAHRKTFLLFSPPLPWLRFNMTRFIPIESNEPKSRG